MRKNKNQLNPNLALFLASLIVMLALGLYFNNDVVVSTVMKCLERITDPLIETVESLKQRLT